VIGEADPDLTTKEHSLVAMRLVMSVALVPMLICPSRDD